MWNQIRLFLEQSDLGLHSLSKRLLKHFNKRQKATFVVIGALRGKIHLSVSPPLQFLSGCGDPSQLITSVCICFNIPTGWETVDTLGDGVNPLILGRTVDDNLCVRTVPHSSPELSESDPFVLAFLCFSSSPFVFFRFNSMGSSSMVTMFERKFSQPMF